MHVHPSVEGVQGFSCFLLHLLSTLEDARVQMAA
eukprot:s4449_g1.t1